MKKFLFFAIIVLFSVAAKAQVNSSATQTVNLNLSNAIEITFTASGTATGDPVALPFTTVNDYANGVTSSDVQLKVRSNKNFAVAVKANSGSFTYTGTTTPAPSMPVAGVLSLKVSANNTGGTIASPFSATTFAGITSTNQNIINAGSKGGNQTFSVQYRADPQFNYPSGNYAVDVVYTATQQ